MAPQPQHPSTAGLVQLKIEKFQREERFKNAAAAGEFSPTFFRH
jgi:hypothetical protein